MQGGGERKRTEDVMCVDVFVLLCSTAAAKKCDAMIFLKHLLDMDRMRKEEAGVFVGMDVKN